MKRLAAPAALVALVVVVVAVAVVPASCVLLQGAGNACTSTADCAQPLGANEPRHECVFVNHAGECVPVVVHKQTACAKASDCDAALFPIEAKCESGSCRCDVVDNCTGDGNVVDHDHCACSHGNEHEFCNTTVDCQLGLNCKNNSCERGTSPGDICNDQFQCTGADLECICDGSASNCDTVIGNCLIADGAGCTKSLDCVGGFCVDGKCSSTCGEGGQLCTESRDCCSASCDDNGTDKSCF